MRTSLREQTAVVPAGFLHAVEISNNTRTFTYPDGTVRVVLHTTTIAVHDHGSVTLFSGRYHSRTTLDRLNDECPTGWSVRQHRGEWFVRHNSDPKGTIRPFHEGIVLSPWTQSH